MGARIPTKPAVLAVVCALLSSLSTKGQLDLAGPAGVCDDFALGRYPGLAWTFDDCIDVWADFQDGPGHGPHSPEVDQWRDTALELREQGSPCLLGSVPGADGIGSTAIRHVATWIFAEEMGCDWLTPAWSSNKAVDADGTMKYCHTIMPKEEREASTNRSAVLELRRCTVANWLSYFQFDEPRVSWPSNGSVKVISESSEMGSLLAGIKDAKKEIEITGPTNRGREHIVFQIGMTTASHHMLHEQSWNTRRRLVTRNVLAKMREKFYRHPRQWYDESPHCLYDSSRLHFAVHVRMGDRHRFADKHPDYAKRLEDVMSTISQEVTWKGLPEPMFHVFSETGEQCPSEKTGFFGEFPAWPVVPDQVTACPATVEHDGIFQVRDKDIMLHFDRDVQNTLSCMIQADGIIMGCSTFGQTSGLFSQGISMFSTHCEGERTPTQYRMIPPMAVSERGHLWVPIVGSWYDPVLKATHIFRNALDVLLETRSRRSRST